MIFCFAGGNSIAFLGDSVGFLAFLIERQQGPFLDLFEGFFYGCSRDCFFRLLFVPRHLLLYSHCWFAVSWFSRPHSLFCLAWSQHTFMNVLLLLCFEAKCESVTSR